MWIPNLITYYLSSQHFGRVCVCVCTGKYTRLHSWCVPTNGIARNRRRRRNIIIIIIIHTKRARCYKAYICKLRYRRHSTRRRDRFAHADFLRAWNQGTTTLLERTKSVAKKTATTLNEEKNINKIVRAPLHLAGKIHIFRQSVRVCEVLPLSGVGWFLGMMIKGRLGKNQTRKNH